ncbi:hypothetical protein BLNAU_15932 [Blattamonas nauphoetae]|uniref:Uncharacterized protein n=1 Tax=Blattamonas nauphoetae TaxID=2049346 RepID=A0ABQ9XFM1_9EUKA|nr:hypothetical protein BLNAU_15932 [Blattamonas nauphoetae]
MVFAPLVLSLNPMLISTDNADNLVPFTTLEEAIESLVADSLSCEISANSSIDTNYTITIPKFYALATSKTRNKIFFSGECEPIIIIPTETADKDYLFHLESFSLEGEAFRTEHMFLVKKGTIQLTNIKVVDNTTGIIILEDNTNCIVSSLTMTESEAIGGKDTENVEEEPLDLLPVFFYQSSTIYASIPSLELACITQNDQHTCGSRELPCATILTSQTHLDPNHADRTIVVLGQCFLFNKTPVFSISLKADTQEPQTQALLVLDHNTTASTTDTELLLCTESSPRKGDTICTMTYPGIAITDCTTTISTSEFKGFKNGALLISGHEEHSTTLDTVKFLQNTADFAHFPSLKKNIDCRDSAVIKLRNVILDSEVQTDSHIAQNDVQPTFWIHSGECTVSFLDDETWNVPNFLPALHSVSSTVTPSAVTVVLVGQLLIPCDFSVEVFSMERTVGTTASLAANGEIEVGTKVSDTLFLLESFVSVYSVIYTSSHAVNESTGSVSVPISVFSNETLDYFFRLTLSTCAPDCSTNVLTDLGFLVKLRDRDPGKFVLSSAALWSIIGSVVGVFVIGMGILVIILVYTNHLKEQEKLRQLEAQQQKQRELEKEKERQRKHRELQRGKRQAERSRSPQSDRPFILDRDLSTIAEDVSVRWSEYSAEPIHQEMDMVEEWEEGEEYEDGEEFEEGEDVDEEEEPNIDWSMFVNPDPQTKEMLDTTEKIMRGNHSWVNNDVKVILNNSLFPTTDHGQSPHNHLIPDTIPWISLTFPITISDELEEWISRGRELKYDSEIGFYCDTDKANSPHILFRDLSLSTNHYLFIVTSTGDPLFASLDEAHLQVPSGNFASPFQTPTALQKTELSWSDIQPFIARVKSLSSGKWPFSTHALTEDGMILRRETKGWKYLPTLNLTDDDSIIQLSSSPNSLWLLSKAGRTFSYSFASWAEIGITPMKQIVSVDEFHTFGLHKTGNIISQWGANGWTALNTGRIAKVEEWGTSFSIVGSNPEKKEQKVEEDDDAILPTHLPFPSPSDNPDDSLGMTIPEETFQQKEDDNVQSAPVLDINSIQVTVDFSLIIHSSPSTLLFSTPKLPQVVTLFLPLSELAPAPALILSLVFLEAVVRIIQANSNSRLLFSDNYVTATALSGGSGQDSDGISLREKRKALKEYFDQTSDYGANDLSHSRQLTFEELESTSVSHSRAASQVPSSLPSPGPSPFIHSQPTHSLLNTHVPSSPHYTPRDLVRSSPFERVASPMFLSQSTFGPSQLEKSSLSRVENLFESEYEIRGRVNPADEGTQEAESPPGDAISENNTAEVLNQQETSVDVVPVEAEEDPPSKPPSGCCLIF